MDVRPITPAFHVRAQVRPEEAADIAAAGYRALVNNRPDGEEPGQPTAEEVGARAREAGLAYLHIPVIPGQARPDQAAELAAFLRGVEGPVLGFCRTGARAEGLCKLAQQVAVDGR